MFGIGRRHAGRYGAAWSQRLRAYGRCHLSRSKKEWTGDSTPGRLHTRRRPPDSWSALGAFVSEHLSWSVSTHATPSSIVNADGRNARKPRPVGRAGTGGRGRLANHARQSAADRRTPMPSTVRPSPRRRSASSYMHAGACVLADTCSPLTCKLTSQEAATSLHTTPTWRRSTAQRHG